VNLNQFERLKLKVEADDIILIKKQDRLGRSTAEMIILTEYSDNLCAAVKFLDDGISTEGAIGRMVISILPIFVEAEHAQIIERTNEERIEAREDIKFGRAIYC